MSNKIYILLFLIVFSVAVGCVKEKDPISSLSERSGPHLLIRGKVILENQTNPANCPVVFDKFMIGTITDSTGNYEIFIPDSLAKLTGTFRIYYYLYDYDLDSLSVKIKNGKVEWGQQDVNDEGFLKTVTLKQLFSWEVISDKSQYIFGEKISLSTKMINKSKRTLWLHTSSVIFIGFYNINTKATVWRGLGTATSDMPHIESGDSLKLGTEIKTREIGLGYFIPVYSINRGNLIPMAVIDFIWNSRTQYENMVTFGYSFFVFIDDPKNLAFPLVNVVQN